MTITESHKHHAQEAADSLWRAFVWSDSPEGHDYWCSVVTKLQHFANTGEFLKEE